MYSGYKKLLKLVPFLILLLTLAVSIIVVRERQEIRKKASSQNQYASTPQPVNTSYSVGAFYMPKYSSLTREYALLYKWNSEESDKKAESDGSGVVRWPLLGMYDEGSSDVLDWQIKWAVEHGIDHFIFDWYWQQYSTQPTWGKSLDSFIKAKYSNYMKFSLFYTATRGFWLGENQVDKPRTETMLRNIVDYWATHYFNKPNFFKIDGKPVVYADFYSTLSDLGYPRALEVMREQARSHGYPDIYFVAMLGFGIGGDSNYYKGRIDEIESASYNAVSSYGYAQKEQVADCTLYPQGFRGFTKDMLSYTQNKNVKFIPSISVFADFRAISNREFGGEPKWYNDPTWCNNPSPELMEQTMRGTLAELDTNKAGGVVINDKPLVVITSWNEWIEGSNFEPGIRVGYGGDPFGYIKAFRNALTNETRQQLAPPQSTGPDNPGPFGLRQESKTSFVFDSQEEADKWLVQEGSSLVVTPEGARSRAAPAYSSYKKALTGDIIVWRGAWLDTDKYSKVRLKFRTRCGYNFDQQCTATDGLIFFMTSSYKGPYSFPPFSERFIGGSGQALQEYETMEIDLSQNSRWTGNLQEFGIRMNFSTSPVQLDLQEVTFIPSTNGNPYGPLDKPNDQDRCTIEGWAFDPDAPNSPVAVRLYDNPADPNNPDKPPFAILTADIYREDLCSSAQTQNTCNHAFRITTREIEDKYKNLLSGDHKIYGVIQNIGAGSDQRLWNDGKVYNYSNCASPTPTSSTSPQSQLDFKIKLQGYENLEGAQVRITLARYGIVIYGPQDIPIQAVPGGAFIGSVTGIEPGQYDVFIKGPVHLQRKFANVDLVGGINNQDWSDSVLLQGDVFDDTGSSSYGDNYIRFSDLTAIMSVWDSSETPVNQLPSDKQKYDLEKDGFIMLSDLTAILANWTSSEVKGDEVR